MSPKRRRDASLGDLVLRSLRKNVGTCDVVFVVENQAFPAHRILLSVISPVFKKMLNNGMKETREREVFLREEKAATFKLLLDSVYGEHIVINDIAHGMEVFKCADKYQYADLEYNLVSLFAHDRNLCPYLFTHVIKTPEMLEKVVQMESLFCPGEAGLFDLVMKCFHRNKWTGIADLEEKEKRILSCIKVQKMNKEEVEYVLKECERLCKESDFLSESPLLKLQVLCYKSLMNNDYISSFKTSPIPHKSRLFSARNKPTFTFRTEFIPEHPMDLKISTRDENTMVTFSIQGTMKSVGEDPELTVIASRGTEKCNCYLFSSYQIFIFGATKQDRYYYSSEDTTPIKIDSNEWLSLYERHGYSKKATIGATIFY